MIYQGLLENIFKTGPLPAELMCTAALYAVSFIDLERFLPSSSRLLAMGMDVTASF